MDTIEMSYSVVSPMLGPLTDGQVVSLDWLLTACQGGGTGAETRHPIELFQHWPPTPRMVRRGVFLDAAKCMIQASLSALEGTRLYTPGRLQWDRLRRCPGSASVSGTTWGVPSPAAV